MDQRRADLQRIQKPERQHNGGPSSRMLCWLSQPQLPPLETKSSQPVSTIAPSTSNRPPVLTSDSIRRGVRRHRWRLRRQPKARRPTAGVKENPAQGQTERSSAQSPSDLVLGQLIAHDADPHRDQGGRETLQGSADDQGHETTGAERGNLRAVRHQVDRHQDRPSSR
jgi:hypothetical protein